MSKPKKIPGSALPDPPDIASMGECTGLMPTPPRSKAERDAYRELYITSTPHPTRNNPHKNIPRADRRDQPK